MERVGGLVEGKGGEKRGGGRDGGGVEQEREGEVPPQKMQRTDMFPFRMLSFSHSEKGPTFYNNSEGGSLSDLYDVPGSAVAVAAAARIVQPFPAAFESPGMASLRFPFTSAQWQELEQQALIYKYMMAAVPIPPDLLIPIRKSLANAAVTSQTSLGWGSYNLRLAGNTDPEPGRCRRTDGKKWRCSRDVAPDQKYCERHMHRGRPRSRKPVEVQIQNKPLASSQTRSSSICAPSSSLATLTCTSSSPLGTKPSQPCGVFLKPSSTADFKLPLQSLVPAVPEKGSRYLNLMKGGGITDSSAPGLMSTTRDPMTDNQQLKLLHSKLVPAQQQPRSSNNGNTSIINYQDYLNLLSEPDLRENHHFSGFNNQRNDHQSCHFLGTDLGSFDPDCAQRHPSRRFIDAWSQSRDSKSLGGKLSLSSLSLSMSRGSGEDIHPTQMGLGVNDSERDSSVKPQPINWMLPVSWQPSPLGGPLAEVLQSSKATANSPPGRSGKSLIGGGLNLMSDGWGEVSPRNSPKLVSSPTGVLQKTLASLSDSSSGSSPTFAAKSEMALQWLNQQHKLPS